MSQKRGPHSVPYHATTSTPISTRAQQRIVTQQAINVLTIKEQATSERIFSPRCLEQHLPTTGPTNLKHYANPMVHPVTGETITSYKKTMKDPATAEIWQTAVGKEFGGMAQGDCFGVMWPPSSRCHIGRDYT